MKKNKKIQDRKSTRVHTPRICDTYSYSIWVLKHMDEGKRNSLEKVKIDRDRMLKKIKLKRWYFDYSLFLLLQFPINHVWIFVHPFPFSLLASCWCPFLLFFFLSSVDWASNFNISKIWWMSYSLEQSIESELCRA